MGRLVHVGVAVGAAADAASPRLVPGAGGAPAAAVAGAHGDAIAFLDAPPLLRLSADLLDDAERLVAGDDGVLHVVLVHGRGAFVLLVVAAADAAGLDAEQSVIGADGGPRELAELEGFRLHQHGRAHRPTHAHPPRGVVRHVCRVPSEPPFVGGILTQLQPPGAGALTLPDPLGRIAASWRASGFPP